MPKRKKQERLPYHEVSQAEAKEWLKQAKKNPETGCLEMPEEFVGRFGYAFKSFRVGSRKSKTGFCAHVLNWVVSGRERPSGDLDHKCSVRHCINLEHLNPVTRQQNVIEGWKRGREPTRRKGLKIEDARYIRKQVASGVTQTSLAVKYGVSVFHINNIVHGRRFAEK